VNASKKKEYFEGRICLQQSTEIQEYYPLEDAAGRGDLQVMKKLAEDGAKVDNGKPRAAAVKGGHETAVRFLLGQETRGDPRFC